MSIIFVPRVRSLARDFSRLHPPHRMRWSWRTAILLHGAVELASVTGDAALFEHVAAFFRDPRHRGVRIRRSDAAACAMPALSLYEATGDRSGLYLVERAAEYLHHAPISTRGAVYHLGSELWARPLPDSVWADSLMMVGVLSARLARFRQDESLRRRALDMVLAFAHHLRDDATGLFHHAHVPALSRAYPAQGSFWLRGNGWMLAAGAQMVSALSPDAAERAMLSRVFAPAAETLALCMQSDGALPTLVGPAVSPGGRIESSGTALVAAGMLGLARLGIVSSSLAPRAMRAAQAAASCIGRDHRGQYILRNASGPTNAGPAWSYALVPDLLNADYGVGALMLAAAEAITSSLEERLPVASVA